MSGSLMNNNENRQTILSQIQEKYDKLSKSHKKIADYIVDRYENVPDLSATQIARAVQVSEATVIRFAVTFGFEGYPEFRKRLKDEIKNRLTTVERIEMVMENDGHTELPDRVVQMILKSDIRSMKETMRAYDEAAFHQAVDLICGARKVIILGFRSTSLLTEHLGYYMNLLLDNVRVVNHGVTDFYEHLIRINQEDVVLAISFPRYSQKTRDVLSFLKKRGPKIITITDNEMAPINQFADYKLIAKSNVYSFVDSLVAPLSLINALLVAIGYKNIKDTKMTFNELEEIWKKNDVYTGNELDGLEENE